MLHVLGISFLYTLPNCNKGPKRKTARDVEATTNLKYSQESSSVGKECSYKCSVPSARIGGGEPCPSINQ